jgi:hypothetical protein
MDRFPARRGDRPERAHHQAVRRAAPGRTGRHRRSARSPAGQEQGLHADGGADRAVQAGHRRPPSARR